MPREYAAQPPAPSGPGAFKYDQYHGGAPVGAAAGAANPAASPMVPSHMRDGNGDVPMHDAHDAHAGIKSYPMRPHHQSHASGGRPPNLHSPQELSSAAQRYSPMETLSPTSPYSQQRQSPTRQGDYPQSPYFTGRSPGQQLPPIQPHIAAFDSYPSSAVSNLDGGYSMDPKSPRRPNPPLIKPVPEFKKVRAVSDLQPKNSRQPPFRRANPEGGFISVSDPPLLACNLA